METAELLPLETQKIVAAHNELIIISRLDRKEALAALVVYIRNYVPKWMIRQYNQSYVVLRNGSRILACSDRMLEYHTRGQSNYRMI